MVLCPEGETESLELRAETTAPNEEQMSSGVTLLHQVKSLDERGVILYRGEPRYNS